MNLRSSIVLTVKEVEAAIRELQQSGIVAINDVLMVINSAAGIHTDDPLESSVTVVIPGVSPNAKDQQVAAADVPVQ